MAQSVGDEERQEGWHPARLIPVAGIRGQEEQEKRATSALLAVLPAVPEFGYLLLGRVGAPRGRIRTYAEVQLKDAEGKVSIPDGAIIVERGKTRWQCLVEVKTSLVDLKPDQVNRYLDMAREHGFDAVVTIPNQITAGPHECPVTVDKRKLRRVELHHLSWWWIITEAVLQHRFRGISDPDQAWILGELIAYLDHENSGASGFHDMGSGWPRIRDGARQNALRAANAEVREASERWEHFVDYLALGLSQDLGREVIPSRPRTQTTHDRLEANVQELVNDGVLSGALKIPDAAGPLQVVANLRTRQLTTSVTLGAPQEGRATARVNWLLRQLADAPVDLRIEVSFPNVRETTSITLERALQFPQQLLNPSDPKRPPRAFALLITRPLGLKGGKGQGSFVRETRRQVVDFYRDVVQTLKPWQPKPPQLPREEQVTTSKQPSPEPPPFSAVDERDAGEGATPLEPAVAPGQTDEGTDGDAETKPLDRWWIRDS